VAVFAIGAEAQNEPARVIGDQPVLVRDADGRAGLLRCHASRPLGHPGAGSTGAAAARLVVVVHGAMRNSDVYLAHARAAAGTVDLSTVIVAPQFLTQADLAGRTDVPHRERTLHWDVEGWKGGAPATGPEQISSFSAMDSLLSQLTGLTGPPGRRSRSVVIIGNSAGGQYVNRYAAVGRVPDELVDSGINVRFVIANPSTYLYFDTTRPVAVPGGKGINTWRYGFDDPPPYVTCPPGESLRRYARRDVTILVGAEDRDGAALLLEVSAAAMAQGANRLERGIHYHHYIQTLTSQAGLPARHRFCQLDGVGHDAGKVLAAAPAREIVFG
jgi:hypothetical protein